MPILNSMKITLIICLTPVLIVLALLSPVLLLIAMTFKLIFLIIDIKYPPEPETDEKRPKKTKKKNEFNLNFTDK